MNTDEFLTINRFAAKRKNPIDCVEYTGKRLKVDNEMISRLQVTCCSPNENNQNMRMDLENSLEFHDSYIIERKKQFMQKVEKERSGYRKQMKFSESGFKYDDCCSPSK